MKKKIVREGIDQLPAIDPDTGMPKGWAQTSASMCEPIHETTADLVEAAEARKVKVENG